MDPLGKPRQTLKEVKDKEYRRLEPGAGHEVATYWPAPKVPDGGWNFILNAANRPESLLD